MLTKINDIAPTAFASLNIVATVVAVELRVQLEQGSSSSPSSKKGIGSETAHVTIADETGCVVFCARGEAQVSKCRIGKLIALQRARIEMLNDSTIVVVVDRWGDIAHLRQENNALLRAEIKQIYQDLGDHDAGDVNAACDSFDMNHFADDSVCLTNNVSWRKYVLVKKQ